jgi:hypothetical protein
VERLFGVGIGEIRRSLEALNGSLTLLVQHPDEPRWTYKHPTIADAFAALISESAELIELYIEGAKLDRLLGEVVCRAVKIEGAAIQVPVRLYEQLLRRLDSQGSNYIVRRFLSSRCDANCFL